MATSVNDEELEGLYEIARRSKDNGNYESAQRYYEMILFKKPSDWEANFFSVYCKVAECKIAQIESAATQLGSAAQSALTLILDSNDTDEVKRSNATVLGFALRNMEVMLKNGAQRHYQGIDSEIRSNYETEMRSRIRAADDAMYGFASSLDSMFGESMKDLILSLSKTAFNSQVSQGFWGRDRALSMSALIKKYDPSFDEKAPIQAAKKTDGCGAAIAILLLIIVIIAYIFGQ